MEKAYGYIRVSSKANVDKDGPERQLEEINRYAGKHGIEIVGTFRDLAVSGIKDETERPAFQDMIAAILGNGVRIVVVEGMDRLAREYRIQETLLIYLASKGITLINARTEENVTEAITSDPMKKALIQIQGVFSELEKSLLVKKLRIAREHVKEKTGKCEGRKSTSELKPEVIHEIKRLRRKNNGRRLSFVNVAKTLNERGFTTASGKPFTGPNAQMIMMRMS